MDIIITLLNNPYYLTHILIVSFCLGIQLSTEILLYLEKSYNQIPKEFIDLMENLGGKNVIICADISIG